jgi:uncharacterized protein YjiS (DUF1127 family)
MRHSTQPQYLVRNTAAESFGRIARITVAATPLLLAPAHRSANDADIALREVGEALAQRALGANGFGDAMLPSAGDSDRPSARQLEADTRIGRSRLAGELAAVAWRAVATRLQQLATGFKQRRAARATYLALRDLDARTLRDIGLHRSEILSVVAELGGDFEATRVHSMHRRRHR